MLKKHTSMIVEEPERKRPMAWKLIMLVCFLSIIKKLITMSRKKRLLTPAAWSGKTFDWMASIHLYFAGKQVGDTQKRGKHEMRSSCRKSLIGVGPARPRPRQLSPTSDTCQSVAILMNRPHCQTKEKRRISLFRHTNFEGNLSAPNPLFFNLTIQGNHFVSFSTFDLCTARKP